MMTGVILAAGLGTRMAPITESIPKCMLPVLDRPVIDTHLAMLAKLDARRAVIVLGPQNAAVGEYVKSRWLAMIPEIDIVLQDTPEGIAAALERALPLVVWPSVVILGDCYFAIRNLGTLRGMIHSGQSGLLIVRDSRVEPVRAGCAVHVDGSGIVKKLVEKPSSPCTNVRAVGVYVLTEDLAEFVARTPPSSFRNEREIATTLQMYVDAGRRLRGAFMDGWDVNLSRPSDVLRCNLYALRQRGLGRWVATTASIGRDCVVSQSVVGSACAVGDSVELRRTVVFSGAAVATHTRHVEVIVLAPSRVVSTTDA